MDTLISDRNTGAVRGINVRKMYRPPFQFTVNQPGEAVVVPANGSVPMSIASVSGEGPCGIDRFSVQKTGVALVGITVSDGGMQRTITRGSVHIDTIFGSGKKPFILPEELYVDELRNITMQFTDLSGSTNTIYPNLGSSRYLKAVPDPKMELARQRINNNQYTSMPMFQSTDGGKVVLTALGTGRDVMSIDNQNHFEIHGITYTSTGKFTFDIIDVGTGESIIDGFDNTNFELVSSLAGGTAEFPFRFDEPILVRAGQQLLARFTDLSNAGNTIYITLFGKAIAMQLWQ